MDRRDVVALAARLGRLADVFGPSSVYAELTDHRLPEDSVAADAMGVAARRAGVLVVASGAVHYAPGRPGSRRRSPRCAAARPWTGPQGT